MERTDDFRPKTNQQEVFNYMVRFEEMNRKLSGLKGIYPTTGMIIETFNISKTRAIWYRKSFEKKFGVTLKAKRNNLN